MRPCNSLVLLAFTVTSAAAQVAFLPPVAPDQNWSSGTPQAVDFDNDGKMDLVNHSTDRVAVLYNNGSNDFTAVTIHVAGGLLGQEIALAFAAGDINGDSKADFAVSVSGSNPRISIFISTGRSFDESTYALQGAALAKCIRIVDLDKDGKVDVVGTNDGGGLFFLKGDGAGEFVVNKLEVFHTLKEIAVAGLNAVGVNDIVGADYDGELEIYLGSAGGTFTREASTLAGPIQSIAVADFSGDNIPDIATVIYNVTGNTFQTYLHTNDGNADFAASAPLPGIITGSLIVLDYNADGRNDLMGAGNISPQQIIALRNNGSNVFTSVDIFEHPAKDAAKLSVSDFNNDGDMEIIAAPYGKAIFVKNFDAGKFRDIESEVFGINGIRVVTADMNQDGFIDFISGNGYTQSIIIYYGDPDYTYGDMKVFEVSSDLYDIAVNDFNSDTYPDIAYTCLESGPTPEAGVILSDGSGGYGGPIVLSQMGHRAAAIADVDGDEIPDLILENKVFFSDGAGGFTESPLITLQNTPGDQIVADIDDDGFPDMLINSINLQKIGYNDGTGAFPTFADVLNEATHANHMTAAYINQDQLLDIVIKEGLEDNDGYAKLKILINQGNRQFSKTEFTGRFGGDLAFADYNHDGRTDFATMRSGKVLVYFQDADGGFELFEITSNYSNFADAGTDDLNDDGKMDIFAYSMDGELIVIFNDFVTAPTMQPSSPEVHDITDVSARVTLNAGNGDGRLLLLRAGTSTAGAPNDGVFYAANSNFAQGSTAGAGNYVVMRKDDTALEITGLQQGTEYVLLAFEYSLSHDNTVINYNQNTPTALTFTTKKNQTISFEDLDNITFSPNTVAIVASADSDLPVSITLISGTATLTGNQLTATAPGPIVVKGSQAGNDEYMPAPDEEFDFCVYPPVPTVTIDATNAAGLTLTSSATSNNQWQANGADLPGATGTTHLPLSGGSYTVKVNYSGCSRTSAAVPVVVTGIQREEEFRVFPNPVVNRVTITAPGAVAISEVSMIDIHGQSVSPVVTIRHNTAELDVEHLAAGMYVVRVSHEGGAFVEKVLKTR